MEIICPKCNHLRQPTDHAPDYECPKCGIIYAKFDKAAQEKASARSTGDWSAIPRNQIPPEYMAQAAVHLPITTTHRIPGREVVKVLDVVSAECVFGVNMLKELFSGVTDFLGGRSATIQSTLRDAKRAAIAQMKEEALALGADGLVGVSLTFTELAGGGKTMLMVVAIGTAVTLEAPQ